MGVKVILGVLPKKERRQGVGGPLISMGLFARQKCFRLVVFSEGMRKARWMVVKSYVSFPDMFL